jgi:hypothetical protein
MAQAKVGVDDDRQRGTAPVLPPDLLPYSQEYAQTASQNAALNQQG